MPPFDLFSILRNSTFLRDSNGANGACFFSGHNPNNRSPLPLVEEKEKPCRVLLLSHQLGGKLTCGRRPSYGFSRLAKAVGARARCPKWSGRQNHCLGVSKTGAPVPAPERARIPETSGNEWCFGRPGGDSICLVCATPSIKATPRNSHPRSTKAIRK